MTLTDLARRSRSFKALSYLTFALLTVSLGCSTTNEPELPSSKDPEAVATLIAGDSGREFMGSITAYSWKDDGRNAGKIFEWIPGEAGSRQTSDATRAGETAHALASFLADDREVVSNAPPNPELWDAYGASLIPYLGATVGDNVGVSSFPPLDRLESSMRRTAAMFAALTKNGDAYRKVSDSASSQAQKYEKAFAMTVVADPMSAAMPDPRRELLRAARLRSLIATGAYIADPDSPEPTASHSQTQMAYEIASPTARIGNPYIDPRFFGERQQLLPPDQISPQDWSIYDAQLSVYLSQWPPITDAIKLYGRAYQAIADGQ